MEDKNEEILKKSDKLKCIENFRNYILKSSSENNLKSLNCLNTKLKEDLISFGIKSQLSTVYLRPIAYKIFLDLLPLEKTIQQWISITFAQRFLYSNLKSKYLKENKEKNEDIIKMDLSRTFPEIKEFNQNKIQNILYNILYIYTKEYEINYKQGMNEIISILFISLFPYYFINNKNISKIEIINAVNSLNNLNGTKIFMKKNINTSKQENKINSNNGIEILFNFFHDENYLEVDLYFLFTNLMKKGFNKFYKDDLLIKNCNNLIKNELKIIDYELYKHCIDINLAYEIFLEKWILSFFDRYTSIENCINLLDLIISHEFKNSKDDNFELQIIDYICLAMMIKYKDILLKKNDEEFLIFCLCYPKIQNLQELIQSSNFISLKFQKKDSNINNLTKRLSVRINPKKPIYWMYSNSKIKKRNTMNNGVTPNSHSFIENKNIKNKLIKKIDFKEKEENKTLEKYNGTFSNMNIKKNSLNLTRKDTDGFKIPNFGNLLNPQFDEIKSEDLIDIYYF